MIHNFYPGPSTLHPYFEDAVQSAIYSGILSMNHRSSAFSSLYEECYELLRHKWNIPKDYRLLFVSSATETWEIIAQSLIANEPSLHIYNGAFGKKSYDVARKLTSLAEEFSFPYYEKLNIDSIEEYPFINICQNETSNGTAISNSSLNLLRSKFADSIISVDVTSSLGGTVLDFSAADIWYGSVQKCLGLPSGMGLIFINDKAIDKVKSKNINLHYNDFMNLITNAKKWQTTHTPNILNIHALKYTQSKTEGIKRIDEQLKKRKQKVLNYLPEYELLTKTHEATSSSILTFDHQYPELIIDEGLHNNIIIGKGYGTWKGNTFRIANFPSISDNSFDVLLRFLKRQ